MELNEIKNLNFAVYEGDAAPQTIELYIFDLDKEKTSVVTAQTMILRFVNIDDYKKQIITQEQKIKLLHLLDECNVINWEEKYENNDILDGNSWKLIIETIDGKKIEKKGINDFPKSFMIFREGLLDIFSEEYKYYNEEIINFLENSNDIKLKNLATDIYRHGNGIKSKNIEKAIKGYEEDSTNMHNLIELANIYYDGIDTEKNIKKALELFIKVADIQESHKNDELFGIFINYDVYYKIGYIYYKEDKIDKSIEYLKKAIPYVPKAYEILIEIYYNIKEYNLVFQYFVEMNSTNEDLYNVLNKNANEIIKNLKELENNICDFEKIKDNITSTLINDNIEEIYNDLLKLLIYYNLAIEPDNRNNLQICKDYINKKEDIFNEICHRFPPNHPAKKIYNKLKFIPDEKITNLLNKIGLHINNYLQKGNNSSLLDIDSDEKVKKYVEKILEN